MIKFIIIEGLNYGKRKKYTKYKCWNYILLRYGTMKWNSKERVKLGDENYSKICIAIGLFVKKDNK